MILSLIACALLALPGAAPPRTYALKDGKELLAEVLSVDGDRVNLKVHVETGTVEVTRPIADVVPHSAFNIMRTAVPPKDIAAHVKLAEFAIENGLVDAAKRTLTRARELADDQGIEPDLERRLVERAVRILDGLFRQMVKEGRIQDARFFLSQILSRRPSRLSDSQKQELVDLVEREVEAQKSAKASAKQAQANEANSAKRDQTLEPLRKRLEKGKESHRRALMISDKGSQAINEFDQAIRSFDSVQKEGRAQMSRNPNDPALADEVQSLVAEAGQYRTSSLLAQASLQVTRGQFNQATKSVNSVLADDPENSQALAMRARIEIAANEDTGWGIGGRR